MGESKIAGGPSYRYRRGSAIVTLRNGKKISGTALYDILKTKGGTKLVYIVLLPKKTKKSK